MSHRARSRVWEVDGGTVWSGVKSTDSNPLRVQVHDARKRSARRYLAFLSIDLETSMLGILGSLGRSTEKAEKTDLSDGTVRRNGENFAHLDNL